MGWRHRIPNGTLTDALTACETCAFNRPNRSRIGGPLARLPHACEEEEASAGLRSKLLSIKEHVGRAWPISTPCCHWGSRVEGRERINKGRVGSARLRWREVSRPSLLVFRIKAWGDPSRPEPRGIGYRVTGSEVRVWGQVGASPDITTAPVCVAEADKMLPILAWQQALGTCRVRALHTPKVCPSRVYTPTVCTPTICT
jgi:hypothetical protein